MSDVDRTWMVLLRDVSPGVRVTGQDSVVTSLVLHGETGLILSTFMAPTAQESLAGAFHAALTRTVQHLQPAAPARIVFLVATAGDVRRAVATTDLGSPELIEAGSMDEADDIFDGLVGHLSGRAQPDEPPTSEDWALLVAQTLAFLRAEPWARWSDASHLALRLTVDGSTRPYVAIVMGNAGVQHGLALYAGTSLPKKLSAPNVPDGTLLLFLDSEEEAPPEFTHKARRYGWPTGEALLTAWVASTPAGPSDLSDLDAQRLQVAVAAVLALDGQGLILAGAGATPLLGEVELSHGRVGRFEIARRATPTRKG